MTIWPCQLRNGGFDTVLELLDFGLACVSRDLGGPADSLTDDLDGDFDVMDLADHLVQLNLFRVHRGTLIPTPIYSTERDKWTMVEHRIPHKILK